MKYSRPGPTQHDLTKIRDRVGGTRGPNIATQPLPGSAPSRELVNAKALTPEQEAVAAANRKNRINRQARKLKGAIAGAAVANSLAVAQKAVAAATPWPVAQKADPPQGDLKEVRRMASAGEPLIDIDKQRDPPAAGATDKLLD